MTQINKSPVQSESVRPVRVSRRETRRGTFLALLAWIFAVYDFIMFGTLLPEIRADFGWSEATATGIATAISIGTTVVVLGIGPIVDRIGRRRGMMVTVGGTAVASGLTALTMNPSYLVGVRSIAGLGLAEQAINATYLNEVYAATEDDKIKKNRGIVYSLVQGGWPLGVFFAAAFTSALLPLVGWRGVFLLATFPALVIVFMRRGLKETPQHSILDQARRLRKSGAVSEADELLRSHDLDHDHGAPLRAIFSRQFRRNTFFLSLVWIFNFFGVTAFTVLGTTLLTDGKGLPFSMSLVVFMVANLCAFIGYLIFGTLGQRYGRRNVIAVGFMLAAVSFGFMLLWADSTASVIIFYALGQSLMAGPFAALMFYMGECYTTDCRGTGTSFLNAMSQPGSIIAGIIITALLAGGASWITTGLIVGVGGVFLSGVAMLACKPMPELADFGAPVGAHRGVGA